jgi:hypothetical protein
MRVSIGLVVLLLLNFGEASAATTPSEANLPDTVHRCLDVRTFDASCLGVYSTTVVIDDEVRHEYNRDQQIAYFDRLKRTETIPKIITLEILGEMEEGAYTLLVYQYVLTNTVHHSLVQPQ